MPLANKYFDILQFRGVNPADPKTIEEAANKVIKLLGDDKLVKLAIQANEKVFVDIINHALNSQPGFGNYPPLAKVITAIMDNNFAFASIKKSISRRGPATFLLVVKRILENGHDEAGVAIFANQEALEIVANRGNIGDMMIEAARNNLKDTVTTIIKNKTAFSVMEKRAPKSFGAALIIAAENGAAEAYIEILRPPKVKAIIKEHSPNPIQTSLVFAERNGHRPAIEHALLLASQLQLPKKTGKKLPKTAAQELAHAK